MIEETERAEHLAFAKLRALRYLNAGDLPQAYSSMVSDLNKRDDCRPHEAVMRLGMLYLIHSDANAIRDWIEGFA